MKLIKIIIIISSVIFLTSCMHSKIRYIQDKNEVFGQINEYANHPPDYNLKKQDILYIKVHSTNEEMGQLFSLSSTEGGGGDGGNFYLQGFTVNDTGYVVMPLVGSVEVEGLTVDETQVLIQKKVDELLNNAIVTVKLVSFYVDFLGEVNGRLSVMQDDINILDAISQMGGVGDYADRKNVLILRKTTTGFKTFRVDLTKRSLLTSDKFYMLPYDMVIVEPLQRKSFRLSVSDYTFVIATISSTVTMAFVLINLMK